MCVTNGLTTIAPIMTSIIPAPISNSSSMLAGMATLRAKRSSPATSNMAECPPPHAVAEAIDLRRLRVLHMSADTATIWSGSRECANPEN